MNQFFEKETDTLVEMTLLGNEKAYEELVVRYENAVRGTAYKVTGNEFSAEDAAQDAFVSAWINLDSLREREKFGSWVCSIAKNRARNLVIHYRNTAADISLNLLENMELMSDGDGVPDLAVLSGISGENEKLYEAVEELSEKIRETVKLHYFEGLSVAEIAERLSLPAGTVKWRLSEGRKKLRKEYGVMENTYDENETLVRRVMRQVEELKLWMLKNDKSGFEAEYRAVLADVEALEESKEKQHALADVLMRGYWWLPGEKNDEMLARIKKAAEESRNEDVMQSVIAYEHDNISGQEKIDFMLNTQLPYLEKHGFVKSMGYLWFWLGHCYLSDNQNESGFEALRKVLEVLEPTDVYYANALAALYTEERRVKSNAPENSIFLRAVGEVYRYIGDKLYFWQQPGYSGGYLDDFNTPLFWNCSRCDGLIYDPDMKVGDSIVSSDGKVTYTYKENGAVVDTPCGAFENCQVFVLDSDSGYLCYAETAFCPGVGIVRQKARSRHGKEHEWQLSSYSLNGGEGILPFAAGNRWNYIFVNPDEGMTYDIENTFEVTAFENGQAVTQARTLILVTGYTDTWEGNMLHARREYYYKDGSFHLTDVSKQMKRAGELAETKRQKVHTAIATEVMEGIHKTDPEFNPDYTERGRWNFFDIYITERENGIIKIPQDNREYSFEWKDMGDCGDEGYPLLYNFLYDILDDAAGCVWSDEWVPGYHMERDFDSYTGNAHVVFDVLDDETVVTPCGTFENCRHITFDLEGLDGGGWSYRGGHKEYWFAPGVGIVKFRSPYKNGELESVWELTDYRGDGDGYFPVRDGLFRRYEPTKLGNGYHASVEYTFDGDEDGMVIFRNALGTQDRANYEG